MKKGIRKALSLLAVTGLLAGSISGCALPSTKQEEPASAAQTEKASEKAAEKPSKMEGTGEEITLRVWDYCDSTVTQRDAFHKEFEEKHPGVKVEYTCMTQDMLSQSIVTSLSSGEGPDVFYLPSTMTLGKAVEEQMVVPISDYIEADWFDSLIDEVFIDGITMIGDDYYGFPEQKAIATSLMFYNKNVLDQAGVTELPKTWDEFLEVCRQVTEKTDAYGLIEGGQQAWRMETLVRTFAQIAGAQVAGFGRVLTVNGKADFDSQGMKDTFAFFQQLVDDGSLHPDTVTISAPVARERFAQNEAAFLVSGMFCIAAWQENNPDLQFGIMPVPTPGPERKYYQAGGDYSMNTYVVASTSKHPEMGAEYLKCMYSEDYSYQKSCVGDGAWLSIVDGINDKYLTNELSKQYYDILNETTVMYPSAERRDTKVNDFYSQVVDVKPGAGDLLQGVFSKSLPDYETALKTLADNSTAEWKRACEAAGVDYQLLDFTGWDMSRDFTPEDYE